MSNKDRRIAAEKHFMNKQADYQKQIKRLADRNLELLHENRSLQEEKKVLKEANDNLQDALNILMKAKDLSEEDMRALIKREQALSNFVGIFDAFNKGGILGYGRY